MTNEERLQIACDALIQRVSALVVEVTNLQVELAAMRKEKEARPVTEAAPIDEQ